MTERVDTFRWTGEGYDIPAAVPGRLLDALCAAGAVPAPSLGLKSREGEWIASRTWELYGGVKLPPEESERVFLCARGVQGRGALFVSGQEAGRFAAGDWEKEITPFLNAKDAVQIRLRFDPAPPCGEPPRAATGVSDGFFTRGVNQLRVTDFYARASFVDGYGVAEFRMLVAPYVPGRYTFRCAAVLRGETLACEETVQALRAQETPVVLRLVTPVPERWRPGEGNEPVLLRMTVLRAGLVCEDRIARVGFRECAFAASPRMQLSVDGERVLLLGAQWRCEEAPAWEKQEKRLSHLQDLGLNCLRTEGLPQERLLEALDRRGMLLYCLLPLEEAAAAQVVRRVRGHACLVAYGCQSVYASFNRPADLSHPQVAALAALCQALDGACPFFGPVPGGPVARPGREELGVGKCVDVFGPDGYPGPEALCRDANADDALLRTIRCPAMPADRAALAGGEPSWPVTTPLWRHRAHTVPDLGMLREWFGLAAGEMEEKCAPLLRFLQAETLRYCAERLRMREKNAAGLFVADPFDAIASLYSCALFDGDAPRPAYYALKDALRPLHVCARLDRMAYYCGTTLEARVDLICALRTQPGPLCVTAALYDAQGNVLASDSFTPQPCTGSAGFFRAQLPDAPGVFVLRLRLESLGTLLDVNDYVICTALSALLWPLAHAPYAAVRLREGEVRNECACVALGVCCGGYISPAWPAFGALLPGESRAVRDGARYDGLNLEPEPPLVR